MIFEHFSVFCIKCCYLGKIVLELKRGVWLFCDSLANSKKKIQFLKKSTHVMEGFFLQIDCTIYFYI